MPDRVGLGPRAAALAVDATAVLLAAFLFGPWLGFRLGLDDYGGLGPGGGGMMAGAAAGSALIVLLYFASEAVWDATPGKRLLGLCLRAADGDELPPAARAVRWAVKNAAALLLLLAVVVSMGLPGLGGWLRLLAHATGIAVGAGCFLALTPARQALHDRVAGSAVFRREDLPEEPWEAPPEEPGG